MKIGIVSAAFAQWSLKDTLQYYRKLGVDAIEIGCGGYPGNAHCHAEELLSDPQKLQDFKNTIKDSGIAISAFACHGNPVHPDPDLAQRDHEVFLRTLEMASEMEVDTVLTFSGCPGDGETSRLPNWVTCPWPEDYLKILNYQWKEKLIPYWEKAGRTALEHGIQHVALEMHPGFCVYNPETLLRLRQAVGPVIGANLDPSHLFWQGIDPVYAIRALKGSIYYVHAKDCKISEANAKTNGVLDTKHYSNEVERAWVFRTVGYGHSETVWRDIFSELRMAGYDGVISLEHEDSLMSLEEGVEKAVSLLQKLVIRQPAAEMWWA